jgi:hypothetical protein
MATHLSNADIQAAIVAKLKASTQITAKVSSLEIREDQWQGTEFVYPNIRVRMISNRPYESEDCTIIDFTVGIQVHTQDASTYEADTIAGIIANVLHGHPWSTSSLLISLRTTNLVPAIRSDIRTWRSEVLMTGLASG